MNVCDIMRADVPTVNEDTSVRETIRLMHSSALSGLPVVDHQGGLVGIVTEHDVIQALMPGYDQLITDEATRPDFNYLLESRAKEVRGWTVSQIMVRNVIALSASDPVIKVASMILVKHVKVLPVLSGGKPIGMVTRVDLANALIG